MKKLLLFISFGFQCCAFGQGQLSINRPNEQLVNHNLQDFELVGPVKTVTFFSTLTNLPYLKCEFNKLGYVTSEYNFNSVGVQDIQPFQYFKYDSIGRLVEAKIYEVGENSEQTHYEKYLYFNSYIGRTIFDSLDGTPTYYEKIYLLPDGNIAKITNKDGTITNKYSYQKNSNGLIVQKESFTSWDGEISKLRFEYNSKGWITLIDFSPNKNSYYSYEYDKLGRVTKEKHYCISPFGGNNQPIEITDVMEWKYNNFNNIVVAQLKTVDLKAPNLSYNYTYQYEYDNRGNWIKKIEFHDGVIFDTTVRTINYH